MLVELEQSPSFHYPLQPQLKMPGTKIDGNAISQDIRNELKDRYVVVVNVRVRVRGNESVW